MSRWLSTFAGQPCLAALRVDWRGHRVRMMWSVTTRAPPSNPRLWLDHGSAWVTWLKCEQQQSACTALAHHELLVLTCCRRACGRTCKVCKTKEHRSLQRRELFTNGFHSALLRATSECTGKVPKADIGKCRCARVLPAPQPTGRTLYGFLVLLCTELSNSMR